jgi:glycosyltransferase involved in cell wall biosynthesis
MQTIVFVADFFLEQGIGGGAERYNEVLINDLVKSGRCVNKVNSHLLHPHQINEKCYYIVANFMNLSEECKRALKNNRYLIIEHDHKYVSTNDPSKFINMLAPKEHIINQDFFANAEAVCCQSKLHSEVLQKNLLIGNIINLGGNLWSDENLDLLSSLVESPKRRKNAILYSLNKNKGMPYTKKYCEKNNIDYEVIEATDYEAFIKEIAATERLFFFPQWLESFNRVVIECRILGCKITTNKLVGATSEPWFKKYEGVELIHFLKKKKEEIFKVFSSIIDKEPLSFIPPIPLPTVSIITSLYKGGPFIKHFMEEVTSQTIFDKCELLIIDANSPDGEYEVIKQYREKYSNIVYERLDFTPTVQETMNLAIEKSKGDILTLWNIDDSRREDALEVLATNLVIDPAVHLVYADSYQTSKKNEKFNNNSSDGIIYEHSRYTFSKQNMIKCLPGPMPMWKKELNEVGGLFDKSLTFAGDWELWLRCVDKGLKFKKIPEILGLYYFNPSGLSTSKENSTPRLAEEKMLFNKYRHVFGEPMYNKFKGHFQ